MDHARRIMIIPWLGSHDTIKPHHHHVTTTYPTRSTPLVLKRQRL